MKDSTTLKNEYETFLIKQGYKSKTQSGNKSTVFDYIKRIDYVCEIENYTWEELVQNIDLIINNYSPNGSKAILGAKSHNAVICSLKQFKIFIKNKKSKTNISNNFLKSELKKRGITYIEKGNSFYEISIENTKYELKCRTYNNNYTFVSKSEIPNITNKILFTIVEWENNTPTNIYLIPMTEWENPNNKILKNRNYEKLKSSPEWGVDINKKNKQELLKYDIDKIIFKLRKEKRKNIIKDLEDNKIKKTEKQALIKIRIGQSKLRKNILKIKKECDICGLNHQNLLIISHIKPWAESNNDEKLDNENILLLCPTHDALFDKGLISFDEQGKILISKHLNNHNIKLSNINKNTYIKIFSKKQAKYLEYHRTNIFKP